MFLPRGLRYVPSAMALVVATLLVLECAYIWSIDLSRGLLVLHCLVGGLIAGSIILFTIWWRYLRRCLNAREGWLRQRALLEDVQRWIHVSVVADKERERLAGLLVNLDRAMSFCADSFMWEPKRSAVLQRQSRDGLARTGAYGEPRDSGADPLEIIEEVALELYQVLVTPEPSETELFMAMDAKWQWMVSRQH